MNSISYELVLTVRFLDRHEGWASVADIAKAVGIARWSANRHVNWLVEQGVVERSNTTIRLYRLKTELTQDGVEARRRIAEADTAYEQAAYRLDC